MPRLAQGTAHVMAYCCRSCSRFCLASFLHVWFMAINVFVDISYVLFSSCMFKADFIFLLILTCKEAFIERFLVQGF